MILNDKKYILFNKKKCLSCLVIVVIYLLNYLSKIKFMELVFLFLNIKLC